MTAFGRWHINAKAGTVVLHVHQGHYYDVPLTEMKTSAITLDWIFQVEEKTWATDADIGNLVRAIRKTFGRGVCTHGVDKPFDALAAFKRRYVDVGPT